MVSQNSAAHTRRHWSVYFHNKDCKPDPRDVKGFAEFFARHKNGLASEREAVKSLQ